MTEEERKKTNDLLRQRSLQLIDINISVQGQVRCSRCGRYEFPEIMHIEKRKRGTSIIKIKTCWGCKNKKVKNS